MRVVILFGTEMGTAEAAADSIAERLSPAHDVSVHDMTDFDVDHLDVRCFHIIVCSTYGDGDLPTGAEPFHAALERRTPDLTGLRFAVFGLGDSVYGDTFNRGGEIITAELVRCGATQLGEHGRHDASTGIRAKDMAGEWAAALDIPAAISARPTRGTPDKGRSASGQGPQRLRLLSSAAQPAARDDP